jgi:CRP-like cAMP-binding protein
MYGLEIEYITALTKSSLFKGVKAAEISELFQGQHVFVKRYSKGALVAFRGDIYENFFIILKGSVSTEFHDYSGRTLKVESITASEPVAAALVFAEDNSLPVDISAETETEILCLPKKTVLHLLQSSEKVLMNYLGDAGHKIQLLAEKLRLIRFKTIRQKISSHLLNLSCKQGSESVELKISKEILAELFGVARPALSREFSAMNDEGLIKQEGKFIHIIDKKGLESILSENMKQN